MSGVLTDIGIAIGKAVARRGVTGWRLFLYLGLFFGFATGGLFGALAYTKMGHHALVVPVAITGVGGLIYFVARLRWLRRATLPSDVAPSRWGRVSPPRLEGQVRVGVSESLDEHGSGGLPSSAARHGCSPE